MGAFSYLSPRTKEEALRALHETGEAARVVAGATNVLPDIRAGKITGGVLVSLGEIEELRFISYRDGTLRVGAATTVAELLDSPLVRRHGFVLWEACRRFADPLVRNQATLGGNLANASPAADTAVPLLALDAVAEIESWRRGVRRVPLIDFFLGPNRTVLGPGELLTAVGFACPQEDAGGSFLKLGLRKAMAISVVSAAVVVAREGEAVREVRIALGAVAPTPLRIRAAEEFLAGKKVEPDLLGELAGLVSREVNPITDIRGTCTYRRHVAGILARRAFLQAWERASGVG